MLSPCSSPATTYGGGYDVPVYHQSHSYRDAVGRTSWVRYYISAIDLATANLNAQVLANAIFNITRAAEQNSLGPYTTPPHPPTYGSTSSQQFAIQDKLKCVFETGAGARVTILVPSPRDRFLADGETLDLTALSVANFVTQWTSNGHCTRDGQLVTAFIGGLRVRTPSRRKPGLYLKNPQLTTPLI